MEASQVSKTIAAQIGNPAFTMMGAKNLVGSDDSLTFKLGAGAVNKGRRVSHVRVTLTPADTYRVEFLAVRKFEAKTLHTSEDIYADSLKTTLEIHTGFALSL